MSKDKWLQKAPWLVLPGALVVVVALFSAPGTRPSEPDRSNIVVMSQSQVNTALEAVLAENPSRKDDRDQMLQDMREGAVGQSLLVKEAFDQGLAQSDYIVRNRLVELQVMTLYESADAKITPEAVEEFFIRNRDRYNKFPKRYFQHLFIPVTNLVNADQARQQLDALYANESAWDEPQWVTEDQVRKTWGPSLARQVFEIDLSHWSEPIQSSMGRHRIRVLDEQQERPYNLDEIRSRVTEDLRRDLRQKGYNEEIERLKKKYKVEWTD